jgi:phage major head subunit gpT-like protein
MGNPLTSAQFVRLLDDRLRKVYVDSYQELPSMIDQIFGMIKSDKAWEEFYGVGALGDIPAFTGQLEYLSVSPEYYTRIEPKEYAGAIQIERKLLDDDRYDVIKGRQNGLIDSYRRVREKKGAECFGYAFSAAWTYMTNEEGVALCSDSHGSKSGVSTATGFDNAGTSALSKTALAAARLAMVGFKNDIGQRIVVEPDMLIVPENLADTAYEITGYSPITGASSQLDSESANNKINVMYKRMKVLVYPRLDDYDTNNWFLVDSKRMKEFLLWVDRIEPDIETETDFETKMIKQSIYGRWGYGWTSWRWIYGSNVS